MGKKHALKRKISWILIFSVFLSIFPQGVSFAAPTGTPAVNSIRFIQSVYSGTRTVNELRISGQDLDKAVPIINDQEIKSGNGITVEESQSGINIKIIGENIQFGLRTNGENKIQFFKNNSITPAVYFNIPKLPTIDTPTDKKVYEGEPITINGGEFQRKAGFVNEASLIIAGQSYSYKDTNPGTGEFTIANDMKSIQVGKLNAGTRNSYLDIEYEMESTPIVGKNTVSDVRATSILKNSIWVIPSIGNLKNLKVIPSKGPIDGNTLLTVTADSNNFSDVMQIVLRSVDNSDLEYVCTSSQIQKDKDGKVIGFEGLTPKVPESSIGKYHLVIRNPSTGQEAVAKEAFEYVEAGNYLQVKDVDNDFAKETEEKQVQVIGKNIFTINTEGVSNYSTKVKEVKRNGPNDDRFFIYYENFDDATYEGQKIKDIRREVEVRIGAVATPIPVIPTDDVSKKTYMTSSQDALEVKTPKISKKDKDYYNVVVETKTVITRADDTTKEVIERAVLPNYFRFDSDRTVPTVSSTEPGYGYYNDRDANNLKPIMIRIKGSSFQAERKEVNGETKLILPKVNFYTGVTGIDSVYNETVAVLDGGVPIDGVYKKVGTEILVKVWPVQKIDPGSSAKLADVIKSLGQPDNDYTKLDAIVEVINPDNGSKKSLVPVFQFRHTNNEQKWPEIEGLYFNGKPINILSTSEEMDVELKVRTQDKDSLVITIDGKKINFTPPTYDATGLAIVKFKTPKMRAGETMLQVIARQGLMDSMIVDYKSYTIPAIKEIIPKEGLSGQSTPTLIPGTTIIIKRDTQKNNIVFRKPDPTAEEKDLKRGTIVLFNSKNYDQPFYDENYTLKTSDYFKDPTDETGTSYLKIPGKYTAILDNDTIMFKVPDGIAPGEYRVQVQNPDGGLNQEEIKFKVINTFGKYTKLKALDPNKGDYKGGVIATLYAEEGTTFVPGIEIYFGSKKAEIVGYSLDYKEAYVKVPPLADKVLKGGESYFVPVTAINTENKSTGTLINGYKYVYPMYDIEIENIRKEGMSTTDPNRNKGSSTGGENVFVEGNNFLVYDTNADGKVDDSDIYPMIYFGRKKIAKENMDFVTRGSGKDPISGKDVIYIERVRVKTPAGTDGPVDVVFINPDGATAIKTNGYIYVGSKPEIDTKASTLSASRFYDNVDIFAKDIYRSGLLAAFGEKIEKKEIGAFKESITIGDIEKLFVEYDPNAEKNVTLYYLAPDGTKVPMDDAYIYDVDSEAKTPGSAVNVGIGETKLIGVNWKNANYHQTLPITNPSLLEKIGDEFVSFKIVKDGTKNVLEVRRGLGRVYNFRTLDTKTNTSSMRVQTPYREKTEKTKIYLINADGTTASADFTFTGGIDMPQIISIPGAKEREVTVDNKKINALVYTADANISTGVIKIEGDFFRDLEDVKIGGIKADVEAVDPYFDWIIVKVPKPTDDKINKPLVITVSTKEGNAYSDVPIPGKREKPLYLMYILPGSAPKITEVSPSEVVETGGNIVEISGTGFSRRDEFGQTGSIQVKFNGVDAIPVQPGPNETENEYVKYIYLDNNNLNPNEIIKIIIKKVPVTNPGTGTITVVNADGGSGTFEFKSISQPKIEKITGPGGGNILFNDTESEIIMTGKRFEKGTRVFIGSKLVEPANAAGDIKLTGVLGVNPVGKNKQMTLVGGYESPEVKVENEITLKFKLPAGIENLGESPNIIVVNPDTGIGSGVTTDVIKPPLPFVPTFRAVPGYNRTIKLYWDMPDKTVINQPKKFEIYGKRKGSEYNYVGDITFDGTNVTTGSTMEFLVKDLKPDTTYYFKVRVLNEYGEAKDLGEADATTLSEERDHKEQDKLDEKDQTIKDIENKAKYEIVGERLVATVGSRETEINLERIEYAKYVNREILIPISQIKSGGTVTIKDKGISMSVNLKSLDVPELKNVTRRDDAVFRIKLQIPDKRMEENITSTLPRNIKKASRVYNVGFEIQNGADTMKVEKLNGTVDLTINYEPGVYGMFSKINLARYNDSKDALDIIGGYIMNPISQGGYYVVTGQK